MWMCPPFWGRAGEGQDQSPAAATSGLTSVPAGSSCLPLTGAIAVLPRAQLSHSACLRRFWQMGGWLLYAGDGARRWVPSGGDLSFLSLGCLICKRKSLSLVIMWMCRDLGTPSP